MIKIDRNVSELWQIACRNIILALSCLLLWLYELPGKSYQEGGDTTYGSKRNSCSVLMVDDLNDLDVDVRMVLRQILK